MKAIIQEYSGVIIAMICVAVFFALTTYAFGNNSSHGIVTRYNTDTLYGNEILAFSDIDAFNAVTDIREAVNRPYFKGDEYITGLTSPYNLKYPGTTGSSAFGDVKAGTIYDTKAKLLTLFAGQNIKLHYGSGTTLSNGVNIASLSGLGNNLTINVTKYTPVMTGGVFSMITTETVDAYDKFGNPIKIDNKQLQVKQIKYNETYYSNGKTESGEKFFIDWDIPARYKVVYRYVDPNTGLKAEYTAMFVNETRPLQNLYEDYYDEWLKENGYIS